MQSIEFMHILDGMSDHSLEGNTNTLVKSALGHALAFRR